MPANDWKVLLTNERTPEFVRFSAMMESQEENRTPLTGEFIAFVGKLGGMNRKEAAALIREQGGTPTTLEDARISLVVVGADELPLDDYDSLLSPELLSQVANDQCRLLSETEFWEKLGLLEEGTNQARLYTPAMLADLLSVSVATIRRWHRRRLIAPAKEIRKLPYFDFQEVATARQIARLIAAGNAPRTIEQKLERLAEFVPSTARSLAQLSIIVEGKDVLLRGQEGLVDSGGQLRFDFETHEREEDPGDQVTISFPEILIQQSHPDQEHHWQSPEEFLEQANSLEDAEDLPAAIDTLRSLLMAHGPAADICFQLAELLYRTGDLAAARERYYMAIELDEEFVEARANLGCLLAETNTPELAIAAFEGALQYHAEFPDAHFHLARTLDELGRSDEADIAWREFLRLAPDSPWADEARIRLRDTPPSDNRP